ncbi:hypothetical protein K0651_06505 [Ornithinimicrobium sp. Arc0846-15]|nr:hypothetical protein [Ornithinimicrobium laminariae]
MSNNNQVRRPKLVPFLISGGVIGLLLGVAFSIFGPASGVASAGQENVIFMFIGAIAGGFVGALAFLVAEWTTLR